MNSKYVSAQEVETHTGGLISARRAYQLARENVFPPGLVLTLGRRRYFDLEKLDSFLAEGGSGFAHGWRRRPPDGSAAPAAEQQQLPFPTR